MVIEEIRCGHCHVNLAGDDQVILTEINTIMHNFCYLKSNEYKKDAGRFIEIINKYHFFNLRLLN